jgi:hypothetical protein
VIFKKCDMSNHRPETVQLCAAGICQHTCPLDTIEKCEHAWTLRYWVSGRQAEKSFRDSIRNGRVVYGSGRKLAQDFQLRLTVEKRSGSAERRVCRMDQELVKSVTGWGVPGALAGNLSR